MDEVPLEITMPEDETDFPVRSLNWRSMGDSGRLYTRSEMQVLRDRIAVLEKQVQEAMEEGYGGQCLVEKLREDMESQATLIARLEADLRHARYWCNFSAAKNMKRLYKATPKAASDGWQVGEEVVS